MDLAANHAQQDPRQLYAVGLHTTRLLLAAGDLVVGWLLLRQAEVARRLLESGERPGDTAYLQGKVAAARFFAAEVLPRLGADRRTITATDTSLMDLPEEAF